MTIEQCAAKCVSVFAVLLAAFFLTPRATAQSLNMDAQSGIFLQPVAEVVPSPEHKFGGLTVSLNMVDAGPVAGDYINVGVAMGYGNWLEFGFTRNFKTDGADPTVSPFFNFRGMNIRKRRPHAVAERFRDVKRPIACIRLYNEKTTHSITGATENSSVTPRRNTADPGAPMKAA